jgi:hypothetical protein
VLDVTTANAFTCSSSCSQIRRACVHVVKATRKIANALCDETRDTCRADCEATDPETCSGNCNDTHAACVAACPADPDPPACQAGCDSVLAQCLDGCLDCEASCNNARVSCREAAQTARREAKLACDASRQTCGETCVDPIDGDCVRQCKDLQHDCSKAAKKFSLECKRSCAKGTARRACVTACGKQLNQAFQLCSDQEALCVAGCIGLTP